MRTFTIVLALVAALSVGFVLLLLRGTRNQATSAVDFLPEIHAAGWLNGDAPTRRALEGKVVVVEAWATWCIPCREATPIVKEVHEKYKSHGVVFIGLTSEPPSEIGIIRSFLQDEGVTWPNGYGAGLTLSALGAEYIPTAWVFGRDGRVVWTGHPAERDQLEQAIERALAKSTAFGQADDIPR